MSFSMSLTGFRKNEKAIFKVVSAGLRAILEKQKSWIDFAQRKWKFDAKEGRQYK